MEKAKGNSSMILSLNIVAMIVKLALLGVVCLRLGLRHDLCRVGDVDIARRVDDLRADCIVSSEELASRRMARIIAFSWSLIRPIFLLALPVMAGKFLLSMGRVIVNGMAAVYGTAGRRGAGGRDPRDASGQLDSARLRRMRRRRSSVKTSARNN
ncbi:MAG: hypothetical protein MZU97_26600 [Bacillus subtilis]|nr:hypothetical protein [Bacillus subtilis]